MSDEELAQLATGLASQGLRGKEGGVELKSIWAADGREPQGRMLIGAQERPRRSWRMSLVRNRLLLHRISLRITCQELQLAAGPL